MSDRRVRKVVIVGGGAAGWMTACALAKVNTPPQFDVQLVESDDIGIIGVGEATIPTIHWFNNLVGLNERDVLRETKATFKLGIEFVNWTGEGSRYFHPFGRYGDAPDGAMFYHRWIRQWLQNPKLDYQDFSLTTALARAEKFARPGQDPRSLAATLGYAFHFDAALYAAYLRRLSESRGVKRVEGRIQSVAQDPETGFVTAVETHKGERIEGDLFIDCSGLRALLIEGALKTGFEDWSAWLPADRALAVPTARVGAPTPFTRSTAHPCGWRWRIPLQHRTGNGLVYSSSFTTDEDAHRTLVSNLEGEALADPRPIRFQTGRRRQAWSKNVVAIGLSSGFLEPLESTSIHLIQSGIAKLLSLFPTRDCDALTVRQFNKVYDDDMVSVRDFLILHYLNSKGRDGDLWAHCQAMAPPDSLTFKMEMFRRTGRVVLNTDELFREASWFAVMMGQGIRPTDFNPLVRAYDEAGDRQHFARLRQAIVAATAAAPAHAQAVDQILAAA
jgi:tryptophan halogenase